MTRHAKLRRRENGVGSGYIYKWAYHTIFMPSLASSLVNVAFVVFRHVRVEDDGKFSFAGDHFALISCYKFLCHIEHQNKKVHSQVFAGFIKP
jgi:hypothetical protein